MTIRGALLPAYCETRRRRFYTFTMFRNGLLELTKKGRFSRPSELNRRSLCAVDKFKNLSGITLIVFIYLFNSQNV